MDYFRPRGDITTVLDLTDRDAQDNTFFPLDTDNSWFHRGEEIQTVYPSSLSIQEFTQRGPGYWGQRFTFEIGALPAGDLLQGIILQIKLGSWYDPQTLKNLETGEYVADTVQFPSDYWTYANSLGTSIIEQAEFVVGDQTIEVLSGEFIRTFLNIYADVNIQFGVSSDGLGNTSILNLSSPTVLGTAFNPNRPFPTEGGILFCVIPFFFLRTRLKEVFPLLACNEGNVRVNIQLRPFHQSVRNFSGVRNNCEETPLGKSVRFLKTSTQEIITVQTSSIVPAFRDFRILTMCSLINGSIRNAYLRKPFEQMCRFVQTFKFDEPLKYAVTKPNPNSDVIDVQLPLELNHPVQELLWVFRRKAVSVNNEWSNFTSAISTQTNPSKVFPSWLKSANIRINGSEVISAEGDWFREHISSMHKGGWVSWASNIYGYSFSRYPDEHQPSGTANMSRTSSVTINLSVNSPIPFLTSGFEDGTANGWEVHVFAIYLNWVRFENGICNKIFTD
jgi:hypothetical protein